MVTSTGRRWSEWGRVSEGSDRDDAVCPDGRVEEWVGPTAGRARVGVGVEVTGGARGEARRGHVSTGHGDGHGPSADGAVDGGFPPAAPLRERRDDPRGAPRRCREAVPHATPLLAECLAAPPPVGGHPHGPALACPHEVAVMGGWWRGTAVSHRVASTNSAETTHWPRDGWPTSSSFRSFDMALPTVDASGE